MLLGQRCRDIRLVSKPHTTNESLYPPLSVKGSRYTSIPKEEYEDTKGAIRKSGLYRSVCYIWADVLSTIYHDISITLPSDNKTVYYIWADVLSTIYHDIAITFPSDDKYQ